MIPFGFVPLNDSGFNSGCFVPANWFVYYFLVIQGNLLWILITSLAFRILSYSGLVGIVRYQLVFLILSQRGKLVRWLVCFAENKLKPLIRKEKRRSNR